MLGTQSAFRLQAHCPAQTSATTRDFAELAAKIRDLLNYEGEHEIEVVDTLFAASRDPAENDLNSVPVLIQYLARLPIAASVTARFRISFRLYAPSCRTTATKSSMFSNGLPTAILSA